MTVTSALGRICLVLALVAGCSLEGDGSSSKFTSAIEPLLVTNLVEIEPSLGDEISASLITVILPKSGRSDTLKRDGKNGEHATWRAPDGTSIVLASGLLTATYGLGHDLYASDVSSLATLIQKGQSGLAVRIHRYLDGENQIQLRTYRCVVKTTPEIGRQDPLPVRRVSESCHGTEVAFENIYSVDIDGGAIWSSRQWVGNKIGYMEIIHADWLPPSVVGIEPILIPVYDIENVRSIEQ